MATARGRATGSLLKLGQGKTVSGYLETMARVWAGAIPPCDEA